MRSLLKPPPPTRSPRPVGVDAALSVLIVTGLAYAAAPESLIAPWIKPLPALAAAVAVAIGLSHRGVTAPALVVGFVIAAVGDLLVEFGSGQRPGTAAFALAVLVLAVALHRLPGRRLATPWPGVGLAAVWAGLSGALVLGELGDRLAGGIAVLVCTAALIAVAAARSAPVGAGALLVATNFTLFAVDAFVAPLPRWLVIGTYDLGLLVLAMAIPRLTGTPDAEQPSSGRVSAGRVSAGRGSAATRG